MEACESEDRGHEPVVASDGQIRVCGDQCHTCIFRPGNLKDLRPGRVAQMVHDAHANEGHIVCHGTLDREKAAICRGFADLPASRERSFALRIGARLGWLVEIDPAADQ